MMPLKPRGKYYGHVTLSELHPDWDVQIPFPDYVVIHKITFPSQRVGETTLCKCSGH